MTLDIRACVFDAYGTLFDVNGPARRFADEIGDKWPAFSQTWRDKQLNYTWLRSLMGAYKDFREVTADALDFAMEANGMKDADLRSRLLDLYNNIDAYPDAVDTLQRLKASGRATAILSNGCTPMLSSGVQASGLGPHLDHVISVDAIKVNKPHNSVYEMVREQMDVKPDNVLFVSSNGWDAHAAAHFGFNVIWLNRTGQPDERLPGSFAARGEQLADVADFLKC
ncbi:haloacid dehalogenase type II [Tepidamorphus sp. 3E244]|uniref:haloacid dehalogenase type II n=1 Tax=Tepidamorphus sp. 3E244 TaxID=3385498 RepID=UPI0038FD1EE2